MSRIVVFGGGGRAGLAAVREALDRGHQVTAVVRDPAAHPDLASTSADVVAGDLSVAEDVDRLVAGHDAVVHAVAPLKGPHEIDKLDPHFFVTAAGNLLGAVTKHGIRRLVLVGHFAALRTPDGRIVAETDAFPDFLEGFVQSHIAGLEQYRQSAEQVDWVMLAPPAALTPESPRTGSYRLGGEEAAPEVKGAPAHLLYADLGVAIVDEIETPTRHRERVAVFDWHGHGGECWTRSRPGRRAGQRVAGRERRRVGRTALLRDRGQRALEPDLPGVRCRGTGGRAAPATDRRPPADGPRRGSGAPDHLGAGWLAGRRAGAARPVPGRSP